MAEIDALTHAVQLVAPIVISCTLIWYCARFFQWLIDRYTVPKRCGMRTASQAQVDRDVKDLLWRGAQRFEDTYPVQQHGPTRRPTDAPVIVPFPQPSDERRRP